MRSVAIVIPVYKKEFNASECLSLKQYVKHLRQYPLILVGPKDLDIGYYKKNIPQTFTFIPFATNYFKDISGYNRLLLSTEFYNAFTDYQYILIYQPDALVFSDELMYWVNKNYDYIGCMWNYNRWVQEVYTYVYKNNFPLYPKIKALWQQLTRKKIAGNGGLCLRKIDSHLNILQKHSQHARTWIKKGYNEDMFWAVLAPLLDKNFRVPGLRDGKGFAFEVSPRLFYKKNNNKLPFGCHAWEKHDPEFWKVFLTK